MRAEHLSGILLQLPDLSGRLRGLPAPDRGNGLLASGLDVWSGGVFRPVLVGGILLPGLPPTGMVPPDLRNRIRERIPVCGVRRWYMAEAGDAVVPDHLRVRSRLEPVELDQVARVLRLFLGNLSRDHLEAVIDEAIAVVPADTGAAAARA